MDNETIDNLFKKFLTEKEWKLFDALHFMPSHFINRRQMSICGILVLEYKSLLAYGARKSEELMELAEQVCRYVLFPCPGQYMLVRRSHI